MMQLTTLRGCHRPRRSQLHQLGGCSPSAGVRTYPSPSRPRARTRMSGAPEHCSAGHT